MSLSENKLPLNHLNQLMNHFSYLRLRMIQNQYFGYPPSVGLQKSGPNIITNLGST